MEKLIIQMTMFRFGAEKFEKNLNEHLLGGWKLVNWKIESIGWFRTLFWARLQKAKGNE